jgi:hypothetical protein
MTPEPNDGYNRSCQEAEQRKIAEKLALLSDAEKKDIFNLGLWFTCDFLPECQLHCLLTYRCYFLKFLWLDYAFNDVEVLISSTLCEIQVETNLYSLACGLSKNISIGIFISIRNNF